MPLNDDERKGYRKAKPPTPISAPRRRTRNAAKRLENKQVSPLSLLLTRSLTRRKILESDDPGSVSPAMLEILNASSHTKLVFPDGFQI